MKDTTPGEVVHPSTGHSSTAGSSPSWDKSHLACLDGFRALLSLWIVLFHTQLYIGIFTTDDVLPAFRDASPLWTQPFFAGAAAVDGFFVLTGFLASLPLISTVEKALPVSIFDTLSRRVLRVLPTFAFCSLLYAWVFFPNGVMPASDLTSAFNLRIFRELLEPSGFTQWPTGCEGSQVAFNLFFMNNMMPSGGCLIHAWSLSVQLHFHVVVVIVYAFFPSRRARVRAFVGIIAASCVARAIAFVLTTRMAGVDVDVIAFFFHFNFYASTFTRIHACFIGVLLAEFILSPRGQEIIASLQKNPLPFHVAWGAIAAITISLLSVLGYADTPIFVFAKAARNSPSSALALRAAVTYVFFSIGSPGMAVFFSGIILAATQSIGVVGAACNAVLSPRFWHMPARLSFVVYLMHSALAEKMYTTVFFRPVGDLPHVVLYCACNLVATYALSFVLYTLVEAPAEALLRRPFPRKVVGYVFPLYCVVTTVVTFLGQFIVFLTTDKVKPYVRSGLQLE